MINHPAIPPIAQMSSMMMFMGIGENDEVRQEQQ
jgi:hypothetical protein